MGPRYNSTYSTVFSNYTNCIVYPLSYMQTIYLEWTYDIDGLAKDCSNSSALAM